MYFVQLARFAFEFTVFFISAMNRGLALSQQLIALPLN